MSIEFRKLVLKFVADETLVVEFAHGKSPRYIPTHQSYRMDKKAIIEMPSCQDRILVDQSVTEKEIERILEKVTLENALYLFAHECGHHLTSNPRYDEALKNCLTLPVKDRADADIQLVIKEETEAWSLGFGELELLGCIIPESAKQMAREKVDEYRVGVTTVEPRRIIPDGYESSPASWNHHIEI